MIEINKIDHVYLYVNSIKESQVYYEELFNIKCFPRAGRENMLTVENGALHFFMIEDVSVTKEFIKKQHISFEVPDIRAIKNSLAGKGIDFKEGKTDFLKRNNYHWCEWQDVNGINIECVEILE